MNITISAKGNTPEARRKRRNVWLAYAFGLLLGMVATALAQKSGPVTLWPLPPGSQGLLAGAILALLFAFLPSGNRFTIVADEALLSTYSGDAIWWRVALADIEAIGIQPEQRKYGFVQNPENLRVSTRNGDSYSLPVMAFERADMDRLIREVSSAIPGASTPKESRP